jgi:hypothetical protein
VIAAEGTGLIVVLGLAAFFYASAGQRGRRQAELSRRLGRAVTVPPSAHAAMVRAMAVLIAGVAVVAFVVIVIRGHS